MLQTKQAVSDVRTAAGVTAARLDVRHFDETQAQPAGEQLLRLADAAGAGEVRLDFAAVEYVSSTGLGQLLVLHKRLRAAGGRLSLCNVRPAVYEVFAVTRLTGVFNVRPQEGAACRCA